jgi:hypothetical protein
VKCIAALLCAASLAAAADIGDLGVRANVGPRAEIVSQVHPGSVSITERDVEAGFVEVKGASRFVVFANSPYVVRFSAAPDWARSIAVRGLPAPVTIDSGGAELRVATPPSRPRRDEASLDYRFELARGTAPGEYPWPLSVTVTLSP